MTKATFTLIIFLIISTLCLAQKQWKYQDLEWCPSILPAAMELLLEKPRLKVVGDSVLMPYEDIIVPSGQHWVKKSADRNCQSPDPNDCLVWCLVEQPEIKTIRAKKVPLNAVKMIEIKKGIFIEKHYYDAAIIEIMCQENAKSALQSAIIEALIKKKWLRKPQKAETEQAYQSFCESNFVNALLQFQQEKELPEGLWDLETLEALNIIK